MLRPPVLIHDLHDLKSQGQYDDYGSGLLAGESVFIKHIRPLLTCSSQRTISNRIIVQTVICTYEVEHMYSVTRYVNHNFIKKSQSSKIFGNYISQFIEKVISSNYIVFNYSEFCLIKKRKINQMIQTPPEHCT